MSRRPTLTAEQVDGAAWVARDIANRVARTRWPDEEWDDDHDAAWAGILAAADRWRPDGGKSWTSWSWVAAWVGVKQDRDRRRGVSYRRSAAHGDRYVKPLHWSHRDSDDTECLPEPVARPLVDTDRGGWQGVPDGALEVVDRLLVSDRDRIVATVDTAAAADLLGVAHGSVNQARGRLARRLRAHPDVVALGVTG